MIAINDYYAALDLAREYHRPLLVDFTGWATIGDRKMEDRTVLSPVAQQFLNRHFVVARLYVDDRSKPPLIYEDSLDCEGHFIETYCDLWQKLQVRNFEESTQPLYVTLDCEERVLNGKATYQSHGTPDEFLYWLREGLNAHDETVGECLKNDIPLK